MEVFQPLFLQVFFSFLSPWSSLWRLQLNMHFVASSYRTADWGSVFFFLIIFSLWASFGIISIAAFKFILCISAIPNLKLISSNVLFFLFYNLYFSSMEVQFGSFLCLLCLYLTFWIMKYSYNDCMSLSNILTSEEVLGQFDLLILPLVIGKITLFLCMPGNFLLDSKYFEFYFVRGSKFLYSHKYAWAYSRMHLISFEMVYSFWFLLLELFRWDWSSAQSRPNFSPLLR